MKWDWDISKIEALDLTDNVVDFLTTAMTHSSSFSQVISARPPPPFFFSFV